MPTRLPNADAMTRTGFHILTDDESLFARLRGFAQTQAIYRLPAYRSLCSLPHGEVVLIDLGSPGLPPAHDHAWRDLCAQLKIGFLSSAPNDAEGLLLLEAGACGYCHSFAAESTIQQMLNVIFSGELWVGRGLMARLLKSVKQAAAPTTDGWKIPLTEREREVASMAAMGESNLTIAESLGITERTVKSHLTTIFEKLGVADRLQLALRVHGIR